MLIINDCELELPLATPNRQAEIAVFDRVELHPSIV